MSAIWRSLLRDERGFVITAELVLISSVLVLGLVAALSAVKAAVAGELGDVAKSIGSLNQSYYTKGFHGCRTANGTYRSRTYGSAFLDEEDSSDEQKADFATVTTENCTVPAPVGGVANSCTAPHCVVPAPVVARCETPCLTAPACGTPCQSSCFGPSVPRVICPPGPGPFTGTDPFAPGVISPRNMLLQGISVNGICASSPPPELPVPEVCPPQPPVVCPTPITQVSGPAPQSLAPGCCESSGPPHHTQFQPAMPLPTVPVSAPANPCLVF
jgi:Flp pilus assembly pilin Flp